MSLSINFNNYISTKLCTKKSLYIIYEILNTNSCIILNRQNKINNEIKKQKKEILDIVYNELREIKKLDKEINTQIKTKTNHFKKTKKFDNIYQTIDTYIDDPRFVYF